MFRSKQLICIGVVALGLLISGSGMVISFLVFPPIPQFVYDFESFVRDPKEASVNRRRVLWAKNGIHMLVLGTSLQLVGTVGQLALLAFRKEKQGSRQEGRQHSMADNQAEDRIEIHWVYKPTDFFDERVELPRGDYTFEIEGGRVTAKMSADVYQPGPYFRKVLSDELENYFRLWQLHTRKAFEIRRGSVDRIHPDGKRDRTLSLDPGVITVRGSDVNLIHTRADGTVHDQRKEQFEARKKLTEVQLSSSADPDVRRMLESYDGSITTPGEELVYLYEIWDALMKKFKGGPVAQSVLNISPTTIGRFRELTCNLPLKQGRHRGRHDVLLDATTDELEEARKLAREMIDKYLKYVGDQRQQSAKP